jgi:peptide/nickel transport system ATP-binding protein
VAEAPVLAAGGLVKRYAARGAAWGRGGRSTLALAGVSVEIAAGEIYGLLGRSGAGKSTLARLLAVLERPDAGEVRYQGERVDALSARQLRRRRRAVQVVFQDPGSSLDPLQSVRAALEEPLLVHRQPAAGRRTARIMELLASVGLPVEEAFLVRLPRGLSGGERQRLAIARALACDPRALLLDEPVSSLDVSVRGQVLNLLLDLRARFGLTMLLIAHDIKVVEAVSDRVGVMLAGRIVEEGRTGEVLRRPLHPYTAALLAASRFAGSAARTGREAGDDGGQGSPACPYLSRCPRAAAPCDTDPELREVAPGHSVACYFPGSD